METKYGIISDIHRIDPRVAGLAMAALVGRGAQKIILNGDISGDEFKSINQEEYLARILESAGIIGLETYVQPASHENVPKLEAVLESLSRKHPNLIYTPDNPKLVLEDHHVVFLPGSDVLDEKVTETGYRIIGQEQKSGARFAHVGDLKKYVTNPEKTVVVCHIPRKFYDLVTGVDVAHFGEAQQEFTYEGEFHRKGRIYADPRGVELSKMGFPIEMKTENRGNVDLKNIFEELDIRKAVNGHFHESVHRANDRTGRHVAEGVLVDELFWNASYMDSLRAGLLTVRDGKVAYENVDLHRR